MIATLVAPILWIGALERLRRWQANRNRPASAGLVTAIALAVMVTLDTPLVTDWFLGRGFTELEVLTLQRLLLLLACAGALVFALALDGELTWPRLIPLALPLPVTALIVITDAVLGRVSTPPMLDYGQSVGLAIETALTYGCLAYTVLFVARASWLASKRTRVHRVQLRILALGGVILGIVAIANVVVGGFLLQRLHVGVWVLRLNRLMLYSGFAGWTLVLMASLVASTLIAMREWYRFRPAYEQVRELFPDLEAVVRDGGDWIEIADARAGVVLDGWAMLARPGDARHADEVSGDRALAVAKWLDQSAAYGSVTAADLEPPPGWRTSRWTAAITTRAEHTTPPLLERLR